MATLKMAELNVRFTQVVNNYLNQGYRFNVSAMSGHQGEIGKVMLTNGEYTLAVYMHEESVEDENPELRWEREVRLTVEQFKDSGNYDRNIGTDYWLGKGIVIEEQHYYRISERGRVANIYTDSKEELIKVHNIHTSRMKARFDAERKAERKELNIKNAQAMAKIIAIVANKTGRKRVNTENIRKVEKRMWRNGEFKFYITTMFNGKEITVNVG